jgi:DNA mismatch repair protein MutL
MQNRYLVVEQGDGIEVIDQHALHERVLFERLKLSVDRGQLEVQSLLVPEQVDLGPKELELISEHASTLEKAGMRIQPFGGSTVLVSSKPVLAGTTSSEEIIREVIDRLAVASSGAETRMLVEEVLHSLACRSAIKAGDQLSQEEVDALIRDRHLVDDAHHCPHGRPTSLLLSKQELDKQFRRI